MNTLGLSLQALGKHGSAHKLLVLALKRRQRYFYYEHPAALSSMSNVAISFQLQNQLEDANYWHAECYEIRRRVLGDDHLETLRSWSNIAVIAYLQKNLPRAEKIFRRVAQKLEIKLGLAHPDTIRAYLNWARYVRHNSTTTGYFSNRKSVPKMLEEEILS
jgi:hypothetical protein